MKKTLLCILGITFMCALAFTVVVNKVPKLAAISQLTLTELEASAQILDIPELPKVEDLEPTKRYCRCKKLDSGNKGCRAGNFVSVRPNCTPTNDDAQCNTNDADCSTADIQDGDED